MASGASVCRCLNGGHSFNLCPIALSKEARNKVIDKLRSKRIAFIMQVVPDSNDSDDNGMNVDECSSEKSSVCKYIENRTHVLLSSHDKYITVLC